MARLDPHRDLISRVATARDRTAFVTLFDHFAPRIKTYVMRLGSGEAVAEEVAQDVMLILWRKAGLFDPDKSSAATWLYRIARNRRIDVLRRDRSQELDREDPMLHPAAPEDPAAAVDAAEREVRVRAALASLPPEQAQLVRLSFFAGLSHNDIASQANIPLGTVKSRIRLAFARLRRTLEADEMVDAG